jgi:hypothetical protein
MPSDEPRRRFMYLEIDEDVHRELCKYASELGISPVLLLEQFSVKCLSDNDGMRSDWETKTFLAMRKLRGRERSLTAINQLAWNCVHEQSEADFDTLKELCDLANISIEKVLEMARDTELEPISYETDRGVKSAMNWLVSNMLPNTEYPVLEVLAKAKGEDYQESVINAAKRNLKIKSIRRGMAWYWLR